MNELTPLTSGGGGGDVQRIIGEASQRTGVRFDFLLDQAQRESGLRPNAKASTSSATGLYQFIDQTWLRLVNEHGHRYGLDQEQRAVGFDGQRYGVVDPAERQRILDLRKDPKLNALMGGEYTRENHARLSQTLSRPVISTDLAVAHFLGAEGASRLLAEMERNPSTDASRMFPAAANANRPVFFESNGQPRSVAEIYDYFQSRDTNALPPGPPPPGRGHFLSAMPATGGRVTLMTAPDTATIGDLWHDLTRPAGR